MIAGVLTRISPKANIVPYKVINSSGNSLWTIEAIVAATNDGMDIINMSLGSYKTVNNPNELLTYETFERAINYATEHNVTIVSSAGNEGVDLDYYSDNLIKYLPSCFDNVITVSATNKSHYITSYSNYGSFINYCAPGGDLIYMDGMIDLSECIYTTYPTYIDNGLTTLGIPQGYMFSYGTSLSAPAVTAGIASLMSYYKAMTGESASRDIAMEYFQSSALDLGTAGYDICFGYGQINIYNALSLVEDKIPPSGEMVSFTLEIQTKVNAEDLVINVSDNKEDSGDVKIYFETTYDSGKLGSQEIVIVLEDSSYNRTYLSGIITMIDTTPPTGKPQKVTIFQEETLKAEQLVYDIHDNAGEAQVTVQLVTDIDTSKVGIYPVALSLKDQSGNEALIESEVEIVVCLEQTEVKLEPETKLKLDPELSVVKPLTASNSMANLSKKEANEVKASVPKTVDGNKIYLLVRIMVINILIMGTICSKKIIKVN